MGQLDLRYVDMNEKGAYMQYFTRLLEGVYTSGGRIQTIFL
jgi:hypothetical protein